MSAAPTEQEHSLGSPAPTGLDITLRTGSGTGRTLLSAFDHALHLAGVADFNLVTLSSVIPTGSRIRHVDAPLPGGHGDLLFCVRAEAFAEHPGDVAWAGLGWVTDASGGGLFVEHHGSTEQAVVDLIEASLADMKATRRQPYGAVSMALTSAECTDQPVCALVLAAYRVSSWYDADPQPAAPAAATIEPSTDAAQHHRVGPRRTHGQGVTQQTSEPPLHDDEIIDPSPELPLPASASGAVARVTIETEVDYVTARHFYDLYQASFTVLETAAVARQVLHESEFLEEMLDPRVRKYVAWDDQDRAIGMATVTTDLDTVPWVSPAYFAHRYPDDVARETVFYLGIVLVHPDHQGAQVPRAMLELMSLELLRAGGVVAWDMCAFNDARGFSQTYRTLLESLGDITIETIDTQSYYAAEYRGPRSATSTEPTS